MRFVLHDWPRPLLENCAKLNGIAFVQGHLDEGTANDDFTADDVDTPQSRRLAMDAAVSSMVLLKNDAKLLPLLLKPAHQPPPAAAAATTTAAAAATATARAAAAASKVQQPPPPLKIALVGPHLNSTSALLAGVGYSGENLLVQQNTIQAAFDRRAAKPNAQSGFTIVGSAVGCDISTGCGDLQLASLHAAIAEADVVIAFIGLYPTGGGDRAYSREISSMLFEYYIRNCICQTPRLF